MKTLPLWNKTMSEGIQEAKQGLEIIQQVQTALPDIRKLG